MLLAVYFLVCWSVFAAGMAAIFAALQVYFRDTTSFLPYFVRIWLYLSRCCGSSRRSPARLQAFLKYNPLYSMLGGLTDLLSAETSRRRGIWVMAAGWAVAAVVVGFCSSCRGSVSSLFVSESREEAVAAPLPVDDVAVRGAERLHHLPHDVRADAHVQDRRGAVRPRRAGGARGQGGPERHLRGASRHLHRHHRRQRCRQVDPDAGAGAASCRRPSGRIEVHGRVSALLALGVGFNPELSGPENVVLGGLANGLSRRQVDERAHDIAEFAELGDFMDLPIRTYSSGMSQPPRVRGRPCTWTPTSCMIDEALSAGDAKFKKKAAEQDARADDDSRAMFLVSHAMAASGRCATPRSGCTRAS